MTAQELKQALRRRHPAEQRMGRRIIHGAWTTIEEYRGIDLLAISAHASPSSGRVAGIRYPRVGYEVKVSRSDYRRELLRPWKRAGQVAWCNAFYFAAPKGLLTADEIAYTEPDWTIADFKRTPCRYADDGTETPPWNSNPGPCHKGRRAHRFIGPLREDEWRYHVEISCDACGGKGYEFVSVVERDAPTLWVPRDVGLLEVDGRGCRVVKQSPLRRDVPGIGPGLPLADLVRWVSVRPDPRHVALASRREVA